ncbi:hypothetical protein CPLU01_11344 [Colletotrichum plurivorum]|uniref:Uncharacterized protein n=1 Tax=Colletotrichum plurivorum TaxID=2175906 RepID=A0A8H6K319_9PEZI|nr:hypothetical protein CPLU01_11344 [Colletotrichum plurivorum]
MNLVCHGHQDNGNRLIIAEIRDDVVVVVVALAESPPSTARLAPRFPLDTRLVLGIALQRTYAHTSAYASEREKRFFEHTGVSIEVCYFVLLTALEGQEKTLRGRRSRAHHQHQAFCTAPALHLQPVALQRTENLTILGLLSPITRLRAVADRLMLLASVGYSAEAGASPAKRRQQRR